MTFSNIPNISNYLYKRSHHITAPGDLQPGFLQDGGIQKNDLFTVFFISFLSI